MILVCKCVNYLLCESPEQPDEWFLELIVALGRDVVVLQILFPVESDLLSLDFPVLDVYLVADQADRDVLADSNQVLVPLWHVLVGDSCADVEHDNAAVASNIVSITESSQFFLTCGIPDVEDNKSLRGVEGHGVHFDTEGRDVLLLELSSQVPLHECGLAYATVAHEHQLELSNRLLFRLSVDHVFKFRFYFYCFCGLQPYNQPKSD